MPLLDLSLVTESLIRLLQRYLEQQSVAVGLPSGSAVMITGYPPDQFAEIDAPYALNLYLYQVQEDGYHKNLPEPLREMGLNLFYLLYTRCRWLSSTSSSPVQMYARFLLYGSDPVHAIHPLARILLTAVWPYDQDFGSVIR